jgi:hypothetical protein
MEARRSHAARCCMTAPDLLRRHGQETISPRKFKRLCDTDRRAGFAFTTAEGISADGPADDGTRTHLAAFGVRLDSATPQ